MLPGRRGLTLVEILIASALALMVGLLALSLFRLVGKASRETTSSYLISRDLEDFQRILRSDLQQTALASIQVLPLEGKAAPLPSLSCLTCLDSAGSPTLSEDGRPEWTGWVVYRLLVSGSGPARLERRILRRTGALPDLCPSPDGPTQEARTLLTNLLPPGQELPGVPRGGTGFRARFLRTGPQGNYELSDQNPARSQDPRGNTRLVEVQLSLVEGLETANPSFLQIPIRVSPRY